MNRVETERVNKVVENNMNKFTKGYNLIMDDDEWCVLRSKFSTTNIIRCEPLPKEAKSISPQ